MAQHRKREVKNVRQAALASATVMGVTAVIAPTASAAQVQVFGANVDVPAGAEELVKLAGQPDVQQKAQEYVNQIAGQANVDQYASVVQGASSSSGANVAAAVSEGQKIVDAARGKIGAPYVWGAAGPDAFDCSGLTSWAYSQVGKSIPRTSYAQAAEGQQVSRDQLQPGDIVAFYSGASHVGIYTGHGTVIHAMNESSPLSETSIDYMPFHSAVRF